MRQAIITGPPNMADNASQPRLNFMNANMKQSTVAVMKSLASSSSQPIRSFGLIRLVNTLCFEPGRKELISVGALLANLPEVSDVLIAGSCADRSSDRTEPGGRETGADGAFVKELTRESPGDAGDFMIIESHFVETFTHERRVGPVHRKQQQAGHVSQHQIAVRRLQDLDGALSQSHEAAVEP